MKLESKVSAKLIKEIMSSRLCSACSVVHPKPWGSQCTAQKDKRPVTDMEGATGGKPETNSSVDNDTAAPTTRARAKINKGKDKQQITIL